jgi:hypothetical protein
MLACINVKAIDVCINIKLRFQFQNFDRKKELRIPSLVLTKQVIFFPFNKRMRRGGSLQKLSKRWQMNITQNLKVT